MWGRFKSPNLLVRSAAPGSTVRLSVGYLSGYPLAVWSFTPQGMAPPSHFLSIKEATLVACFLLISFLQQLASSHQCTPLHKPSSLPYILTTSTMPRATATTRCVSAATDPRSSSPYPLRSCRRRDLANLPVEQPAFTGRWGQPIIIDNPAPVAPPAELPAFINIPAPPGLGSPMSCPQTPARPGLNSPVFRPETPRPANLDSPVFSSDKENTFVHQLASPVYQPGSPAHPLPNGDGQFAGNPGPFLVH
ncbi:hypothetical protein PCASD_06148 [Puccinia coronata f. sp. avenae]|uniref:Uncharacterized protein n=1 Tax=Puccinia coronata f. sp. avenae TaxID=200324 RepID=A0A2N5UZZ9_9BASI|nr:hypothetical protein PCASD_06148 [Puccinia coronata f. sp. avenae]